MKYLLASELAMFYDERVLKQYAADSSTPSNTIETNIVNTAIRAASAELDSALQQGRMYDRETLEQWCDDARATDATDETKKKATIIQELVAHLTFGRLVARRGIAAAQVAEMAPMFVEAKARILSLAAGSTIFDDDAPKDAGVPTLVTIGKQIQNSITQQNRLFSAANPVGYWQ